jgi:hypothetical protein
MIFYSILFYSDQLTPPPFSLSFFLSFLFSFSLSFLLSLFPSFFLSFLYYLFLSFVLTFTHVIKLIFHPYLQQLLTSPYRSYSTINTILRYRTPHPTQLQYSKPTRLQYFPHYSATVFPTLLSYSIHYCTSCSSTVLHTLLSYSTPHPT